MASVFVATAALAAAEPGHVTIHGAIIDHQPVRPSAVSGALAVCVRIDVRTMKGERFPVYQIYLWDKQTIPTAGGGCTIEYHVEKRAACDVGIGPLPKDELLHPGATIRMADRISCAVAPM